VLSSLATVRPTPDLHRRCTVQPRLPTRLRLAPPANLRLCLPTQPPTLIGCQILQLAFQPVSSLRLQPAVPLNLLADSFDSRLRIRPQPRLSVPPATRAACRSSSLPSVRPRSSRPSALRPVPPSCRLPACAFRRSSGPAFEPNLRLIGCCILRLRLHADLTACASGQPSGCAFRPASSSRLPPTFQLCLRTCLQLAPPAVPGSAFVPISSLRLPSTFRPTVAPVSSLRLRPRSWLRFRVCLQLAPPANPPALPSDPTSDSHRMSHSPVGLQFVSSLRLQPTFFAQPSGLTFDLRLRSCPQAPPFDQPATRVAC